MTSQRLETGQCLEVRRKEELRIKSRGEGGGGEGDDLGVSLQRELLS